MNIREEALLIDCAGEQQLAIVAQPESASLRLGVLVIVGGPQYRVGSHRQFLLLARALAAAGIACMRFDYRGMGDSDGRMRSFEDIDADIACAVDAFLATVPALRGVVLWGLCDGASAACFYAPQDARVAGMILLNPWVRTEAGEAKVMLKNYYLRRMLAPEFWRKLLSGRFSLTQSLTSLFGMLRKAGGSAPVTANLAVLPADAPLTQRLPHSMLRADRAMLILLSGRDFVAAEFIAEMDKSSLWPKIMASRHAELRRFSDANHTFSSRAWREAVELASIEWTRALANRL
ncbi:MAG TPA: hydrolase 1, exosortase A system-associated [Rhodocyclaceae bacterium]|nr:hydrolase 1, exosortase A system-associated [Rhodocyclaceae bacterium]